jgi:hypothetical protein
VLVVAAVCAVCAVAGMPAVRRLCLIGGLVTGGRDLAFDTVIDTAIDTVIDTVYVSCAMTGVWLHRACPSRHFVPPAPQIP